MAQGYTDL